MREVQRKQMQFGEVDPGFVFIDPKNRDELTHVLIGLQSVHADEELRQILFQELESLIPEYQTGKGGRPGLSMWEIFVLAVVRLCCNWDYDTLKSQADHHGQLRQILGVGWAENRSYPLQTLRDNLSLLTVEVIARLNVKIVKGGHRILGIEEELEARGDSFPVQSNVHFPTDINLLFDAMRKSITLVARLAEELGLSGWRKSKYNLEQIRYQFLNTQRLKHSSSQDEKVKEARAGEIRKRHQQYIDDCRGMLDRVESTLKEVDLNSPLLPITIYGRINEIKYFVQHAQHQIELIQRRVINDEKIPHGEKVFSIFEEYTEWISKGKAGISQELGLNVCVITDHHNFILHHRVMQDETDVDIAVPVVKEVLKDFNLKSMSFDKGFHSPENQAELAEVVEQVVLPKKGKLSKERQKVEREPEFIRLRHAHSAIESTINGLDHSGLDRCPDRTVTGFRRYVAIGVIARNLKTLGAAIRSRLLKQSA